MLKDCCVPTIVVGYDGSESSRAAIDLAAERAGADGLVVVVHAYGSRATSDPEGLTAGALRGRALLDALLIDADALLATGYETELLEGPPAVTVAELAVAWDAREIIVGASGQRHGGTWLGSVSHELLRIADRPVTVVPNAARAHLGPRTQVIEATT
jgi:nucleotide-binding universal stress UspA family protein